MHDDGPSANPAQAETLFAIANGAIGVPVWVALNSAAPPWVRW